MSRISDEAKIITITGRLIALMVWAAALGLFLFMMVVFGTPRNPPWPFRIYVGVVVPVLLGFWALLVAYVNADAKRRGMNSLMWTLLAVLVPNAIGIILYFVLRDPVMFPCGSCGQRIKAGYAFCPLCGARLGTACNACGRPVERGWVNCAYCGAKL